MFKLDRTAFRKQSFEEAANYTTAYKKLTVNERLRIAYYLNSIAYNFDINYPPKMDKTVFEIRKGSHE